MTYLFVNKELKFNSAIPNYKDCSLKNEYAADAVEQYSLGSKKNNEGSKTLPLFLRF